VLGAGVEAVATGVGVCVVGVTVVAGGVLGVELVATVVAARVLAGALVMVLAELLALGVKCDTAGAIDAGAVTGVLGTTWA
jgi:hypothetical protein